MKTSLSSLAAALTLSSCAMSGGTVNIETCDPHHGHHHGGRRIGVVRERVVRVVHDLPPERVHPGLHPVHDAYWEGVLDAYKVQRASR